MSLEEFLDNALYLRYNFLKHSAISSLLDFSVRFSFSARKSPICAGDFTSMDLIIGFRVEISFFLNCFRNVKKVI